MPRIVTGCYGLRSRDFRPEGIIGAYDFAQGQLARKDGQKVTDGVSFFYVGIDHPYAVKSDETPSCLPENSIGGWGMITTGKNLGENLGEFSQYISKRDHLVDAHGIPKEVVNISANPKYGSEKKGGAHQLFLGRGARPCAGQLRFGTCDRGALLRSQEIPTHQSLARHAGRRRFRVGIRRNRR